MRIVSDRQRSVGGDPNSRVHIPPRSGTIERVETDAEGAAFEAHIVKADGTHVTVKLNSDLSVASIENGRG